MLDLEWNQAMSPKSSAFKRLPIPLRGEIIEIGAVKLNDDMTPGEEFRLYVKPMFFHRMHYKVKKLTGIDAKLLSTGEFFPEAMRQFREWCGDGCTFFTWGYDDKGIMEQNIIVHDLDWGWIDGWINLQVIYNSQVSGDKTQKALTTAMEHFGIEQTRVAHDALGDAYNTALVCSHLDMERGIDEYNSGVRHLNVAPEASADTDMQPEPLEHTGYNGFATRAEAMEDERVSRVKCPDCGTELAFSTWVNQGDRRYMALTACPEHGKFLLRLKFRKIDENDWGVNRILYRCDEHMEEFYNRKTEIARMQRRNRNKKRPSSKTRRRKKKQAARAAQTAQQQNGTDNPPADNTATGE